MHAEVDLRKVRRWRWLRILVATVRRYIQNQGGTLAGSVAYSWLLSMFPLLILASAGGAFVGRPGDTAALAWRLVGYAPPVVRDVLQPVIEQVLSQRSQALLALGLFVTVWIASSGMQAVRTALNRAYGVTHGLSFWAARLKVIVFTLLGGAFALMAFGSVVVMPYVMQALNQSAPDGQTLRWMLEGVRHGSAFLILAAVFGGLYAWLPDKRLHAREVWPGALLAAMLWVCAALALTTTLRTAGKLVLVYGSLAGIVATLIFLYVSAALLILGAEFNVSLTRESARNVEG